MNWLLMSLICPEFVLLSLLVVTWPFKLLVVEVWFPLAMSSLELWFVAIIVLVLSVMTL